MASPYAWSLHYPLRHAGSRGNRSKLPSRSLDKRLPRQCETGRSLITGRENSSTNLEEEELTARPHSCEWYMSFARDHSLFPWSVVSAVFADARVLPSRRSLCECVHERPSSVRVVASFSSSSFAIQVRSHVALHLPNRLPQKKKLHGGGHDWREIPFLLCYVAFGFSPKSVVFGLLWNRGDFFLPNASILQGVAFWTSRTIAKRLDLTFGSSLCLRDLPVERTPRNTEGREHLPL